MDAKLKKDIKKEFEDIEKANGFIAISQKYSVTTREVKELYAEYNAEKPAQPEDEVLL